MQDLLHTEVAGRLEDRFARVEIPKKLVLLEEPFTIDDGSLTPTQKVRRRVVEERFSGVIDSLYTEANVERAVFTAASALAPEEA